MKHHSGKEYADAARKAGLRVENGRGDHTKIFGPAGRGVMVVNLKKDLSIGVEISVSKWLASLGVLLSLLILGVFLMGIL